VWIVIVGAIFSFAASMGIGANDAANAFATSVGAKTLKLWHALIICAIFEFSGAVFMGSHVGETVRKGITSEKNFAAEPEKLMDHDGSGADFMEKLLRGYRMVWPPATPSSARAASSVAEASNAVLVGTSSSWQSPADPAGGDGSPRSPPLLQNKPVGHLKRGKFRKLPRVRTALPFGTLVMSGGTTGMSGTLHRVEECSVLGRDVQLTVSLLSSNRPIPQPYSDSHTDSVPSCAESTSARGASGRGICRASLSTTSTS
jgi:hypothetical protein